MTAPLQDIRVLVPRPAKRSAGLIGLLRRAGAIPLVFPLIETVPELGSADARTAVRDLATGAFDWVAFTSAAAVDAVVAVRHAARVADSDVASGGLENLEEAGSDEAGIVAPSTRVASVGHVTAAALKSVGCHVDLVPSGAQSGAALADSWPTEPAGRSVLLPHSDRARPELADGLRRSGHLVYPVVVYRTVLQPPPEALASELAAGSICAVLLTSPSTCAAVSSAGSGSPRTGSARTGDARISPSVVIIAIGPTTAAAAVDAGISVTAVASEASDAGLVDALIRTIRNRAQEQIK